MKSVRSPVFGFRKQPSMVDFPGRMAAVFFTTGCNFHCGFCHNAGLLGEPRPGYPWERLRGVCSRFLDQWVDGAVITGGEPTLAPELPELVAFLKGVGFAVKVDSNGSRPEVLAQLLPDLAYVAMDVKCGLSSYPEFVKFPDTGKIAQSVDLLRGSGVPYEFRTTVVQSFHTDEEMRAIGRLINPARRYVLQPFVPRDDLPAPAFRREPRTPPDRLDYLGDFMRVFAAEVVVRGA